MKKLVIIGAGGFGREVEWLVERINKCTEEWDLIGFVDDGVEKGTVVRNSKVIMNTADLKEYNEELYVAIAVGSARIRKIIYEKIKENSNLKYANLIDPSVLIGDLNLGVGNIICAGTIVTVNVNLGNFNIINLDCTIGHDDIIKDFVTIYPSVNVSGNVVIDNYTEVGTGTQIIQGKNICSEVIIGAGATVVKNIEESGTYVGVPVKKLIK